DLLRGAQAVVDEVARELLREGRGGADAGALFRWPRARLRERPAFLVGAVLRTALDEAGDALGPDGGGGRDRLTSRVIDPVARAVRDACTEPRRFGVAGGR